MYEDHRHKNFRMDLQQKVNSNVKGIYFVRWNNYVQLMNPIEVILS